METQYYGGLLQSLVEMRRLALGEMLPGLPVHARKIDRNG